MKNKISLALIILLLFLGSCQSPHHAAIQFSKVFGGSGADYITSVIKTGDGGYILAGSSNSHDKDLKMIDNYKGTAAWILKLDSLGNIKWQKTVGGSLSTYASSIITTRQGAYVMVCGANINDKALNSENGNYNSLVVKFNDSGDIVWQKTLDGLSCYYNHSIAITADGGYVIAGSATNKKNDVSGNFKHEGFRARITKLDSTGNIVWQESPGGNSDITGLPTAITTTSNGGFVLAGNIFTDNHGNTSGPHGVQDIWVVKVDSNGHTVWQKVLGGSSSDYANSITTTSDGKYVMAGYTSSNDGDVTGNHGLQDAWIVKLDDNGNLIWQKTLGGKKSDYANNIVKCADGGTLMAGRTIIKDGILMGNGNDDAWVVKLDSSGNILWEETFGGSRIDDARSVIERSGNSYIMAGFSNSVDGDISGNHGDFDAWVAAIGKP